MLNTSQRRGVGLVISAPSGAGKTTLTTALRAAEPELTVSVSATTRAPRPGELDGVHYLFHTPVTFGRMREQGEFLEHADVFGRAYGTPRQPVEAALAAGRDVIFDIDWQGWRQLRAACPADMVGIFLLPPSLGALEARLRGRSTDADAEIGRRMAAARAEIAHWAEFDYVLINDDFGTCLAAIRAILAAARSATPRATGAASLAAALLDTPP